MNKVQQIDAVALRKLQTSNNNLCLIDVRRDDEWQKADW